MYAQFVRRHGTCCMYGMNGHLRDESCTSCMCIASHFAFDKQTENSQAKNRLESASVAFHYMNRAQGTAIATVTAVAAVAPYAACIMRCFRFIFFLKSFVLRLKA